MMQAMVFVFGNIVKKRLTEVLMMISFALRTFARNFSNIDFSLKILSLKDDELLMSEM